MINPDTNTIVNKLGVEAADAGIVYHRELPK
jgi:hypothetical protein